MPLTISKTIEIYGDKRRIGRNDPCYCGSGRKYKKCCLLKDEGYQQDDRQGYIKKIIDWLMKQDWFPSMLNKEIKAIYGEKPELEDSQVSEIIEALVFEKTIKGKTPLEYFIEQAPLSEGEKKYYRRWVGQSRFSFFRVLEVRFGSSLTVKDFFSGQQFHVFETLGTYALEKGMVITGRIVPFAESWMFTGGNMQLYPQEAVYGLEREQSLHNLEMIGQLEYITIFRQKNDAAYSREKGEKNVPGPKEQSLLRQMLHEAELKFKNQLGGKKMNKLLQEFGDRWFATPQKELKGRTPKDIIMDERKKLNNPYRELTYAFTVNRIGS